ncbi:Regulatory protein [Paraburkholderia ribeironis]|uniref:Regulatory protein n=1 Tax=Paraburkholderia ribeironis TaxID=1247936 RepID=A0A1N7SBN1_9BURK|nr:class I SAM-dependent methyltransferase [Paraburkholderia ribeironis]SIT44741.1 Regulatory protein [Paraburkholderia ribeironis]
MYSKTQIDPVVSFRNSQGEQVRGTIINLQRKSLVMEVYNPYSIVQVSEVLSDLSVKMGVEHAYSGKAVVISMVNTGLTAIISVTLIAEWRELSGGAALEARAVGEEARRFAQDWAERFQIRRDYQIAVNQIRAFLSDMSRWVEQADLVDTMPKEGKSLREDFFLELASPLMERTKFYFDEFEGEARLVDEELAPAHRAFAQAALHPLLLRSPFVFRTFTKPLGYAGDYQMVNQMLDDPRQGPSTYFQIVNAAFLQTAVARAHRNRIELLVDYLTRLANEARAARRPFRVLNVGCGPAQEIQRFMHEYDEPQWLTFELLDFSQETLDWTRDRLGAIAQKTATRMTISYTQDSVHHLLKRRMDADAPDVREFDAVYCAGLFDYLSDKVCARLNQYFASRTKRGGRLLVTNVHADNPERFSMEHVLEWYLIYRNEAQMAEIMPENCGEPRLYTDPTGVNVFAEVMIGQQQVA